MTNRLFGIGDHVAAIESCSVPAGEVARIVGVTRMHGPTPDHALIILVGSRDEKTFTVPFSNLSHVTHQAKNM